MMPAWKRKVREHSIEKNENGILFKTGGSAGHSREMHLGSDGSDDGNGNRQAQYPADQPPDERGGGA